MGVIFMSFLKGVFMKESIFPKTSRSRITYEERCTIETLLNEHCSIRYIASKLGKSVATVSREIKRHSVITHAVGNDCSNKKFCHQKSVCGNSTCNRSCKTCPRCKNYCQNYAQFFCDTIQAPPYVCNGCSKHAYCHLEKRNYHAKEADKEYRETLINRRNGFDLSLEQIISINEMVSPMLKNGLSPYHIKNVLGEKLPISEATLRRMINNCELDARNIDLREQTKRKPRKHNNTVHYERNVALKEGHRYADYLKYMEIHDLPAIQMDCVEGRQGENATLLTLHFPQFHMQLAFIMDEHTSSQVVSTLDKIESALGKELFSSIFETILTDNGHEFLDIEGMEKSIYGGKRTTIFFCEPNRSDQKGSCENSHKLIRYIIPKGSSLEPFFQSDITLMMNHINSYSRKALYGKSPYELATKILPEDFFSLLGLEMIKAEEIILKPSLLKRKN